MSTAKDSLRQGSGTQASALVAGGSPSACEEFNGETTASNTKTITTS
jgi:hypothetical protein